MTWPQLLARRKNTPPRLLYCMTAAEINKTCPETNETCSLNNETGPLKDEAQPFRVV